MNLSKDRAKQVVFLLEEADRLLSRHGWCQYTLVNEYDELCLVGALQRASARVPRDYRQFAFGFALDVLRVVVEAGADFLLPTWNDDRERTVEDVHSAIKESIVRVEEMVR